jgi:hypothetical protein
MKNITINFIGAASIRHNKVVVDYTELKELVNNAYSLLEALKELSEYEVMGCSSDVLSDSIEEIKCIAKAAIKEAEK